MARGGWNYASRVAPVAALLMLVPLAISTTNALEPSPSRELWDLSNERVIQLSAAQPFTAAVDLGVFGSFTPGITLEDAAREHGAPQRLFEGAYYSNWRYARYTTARSVVDVAYEPGEDSCGTHHRRTLYAYPADQPWKAAAVLPVVSGSVFGQPTRVLVISSDRSERVWCLVRGDEVHAINWHRDQKTSG